MTIRTVLPSVFEGVTVARQEMRNQLIRPLLSALLRRIEVPILLSSKNVLCLCLVSLVQTPKDLGDQGEWPCEIPI
jgi:hypothetical protein